MKRKKTLVVSAAVVLALSVCAVPAFAATHETPVKGTSRLEQREGNDGVCPVTGEENCKEQNQNADRPCGSQTGHKMGHGNGHHSGKRVHDGSCTIQ